MRQIIFICLRYLDESESNVTIGGIQTYITNLISVSKKIGLKCVVVQPSNHAFNLVRDEVTIIGVKTSERNGFRKFKHDLFNVAHKEYKDGDIILFATERLSVNTNIKNTIAIQHGISWDITSIKKRNSFQRAVFLARRSYRAGSLIRDSLRVKKLVCVDYNYINWYRTQVDSVNVDYTVIPNFSNISENRLVIPDNQVIKIIFARRLHEFRGTRIFGLAIKRILQEFPNIEVTIAGDGPDEYYLKDLLKGYPVIFTTYSSDESLKINADKHIAVVPSIGSEGTSLSLIEAMSCGCAPVATDVGGMTNIIINKFNGLLIKPVENELYEAIKYLILHTDERERISNNAYNTVVSSFSYKRWEEQWISVLKDLVKTDE